MKTLEELIAMCEVSGDCIIWHGATTKDGAPCYSGINIRREVYIKGGVDLHRNQHVKMKCGELGCLCRAHMVVKTKSQINRETSKSIASRLLRSAAAKKNQAGRKLDEEKARYIRESEKSASELARELGISQNLAWMVRMGKRWKPANHFAGLMR